MDENEIRQRVLGFVSEVKYQLELSASNKHDPRVESAIINATGRIIAAYVEVWSKQ